MKSNQNSYWFVFLFSTVALATSCSGNGEGGKDDAGGFADGGSGGLADTAGGANGGSKRQFANMFAAKACNMVSGKYLRDNYCGGKAGGEPKDFDQVRFDRLYELLDDKTVYPTGTGVFARFAVPMCEDGTNDLDSDGKCKSDGKERIRCTDGTRPVGFIRQPKTGSPHVKDWLLRVQGGGDACATADNTLNCYAVAGLDFTSATVRSRGTFTGIFNSKPPTGSPPLFEFGAVYMTKCTGDRNTGAGRVDNYPYLRGETVDGASQDNNGLLKADLPQTDAGSGPAYFHGRRMVFAVIAKLAKDTQINAGSRLSAGSRLLLVTQSNGSQGLYQYLDDVAARTDTVAGGDVDVRGAPSSLLRNSLVVENYLLSGKWGDFSTGGVINAPQSTKEGLMEYNATHSKYSAGYHVPDGSLGNPAHGGVINSDAIVDGGPEAQRYIDWGADLDASCLAKGEPWHCNEAMAVALEDVDTPMFVSAQTADHKVRGFMASFARPPNSTLRARMGYHPNDFDKRTRAMVTRLEARKRGHGFFVTNTDDHMSLSSDAKIKRQIGGLTLPTVLYGWLVAKPGTATSCVSKPRTGQQAWFHVLKGTKGEYKDAGADPSHTCVGAKF